MPITYDMIEAALRAFCEAAPHAQVHIRSTNDFLAMRHAIEVMLTPKSVVSAFDKPMFNIDVHKDAGAGESAGILLEGWNNGQRVGFCFLSDGGRVSILDYSQVQALWEHLGAYLVKFAPKSPSGPVGLYDPVQAMLKEPR